MYTADSNILKQINKFIWNCAYISLIFYFWLHLFWFIKNKKIENYIMSMPKEQSLENNIICKTNFNNKKYCNFVKRNIIKDVKYVYGITNNKYKNEMKKYLFYKIKYYVEDNCLSWNKIEYNTLWEKVTDFYWNNKSIEIKIFIWNIIRWKKKRKEATQSFGWKYNFTWSLDATIIHEIWHVLYSDIFSNNDKNHYNKLFKKYFWTKNKKNKNFFITLYWKTNSNENFSEFFAEVLLYNWCYTKSTYLQKDYKIFYNFLLQREKILNKYINIKKIKKNKEKSNYCLINRMYQNLFISLK